MALDKKKFLTRAISAVVFVIVLLTSIFVNYYTFSLLFFIVSLWGLHEFYKLMELKEIKPIKILGFIIATLIYVTTFFWFGNQIRLIRTPVVFFPMALFLIAILFFISFSIELFRNKEKPFENISVTLFGVIYTVLPFAFFHYIACPISNAAMVFASQNYEPFLVFGLFLLIWSNDTFAYLVGSFVGKNKMFERISPGKTWEGTIGGAVLTIVFASFFNNWFGSFSFYQWMVIGGIVAIMGTIGDLIESMLKRSVGVKDSGNVMPGHGGILDRFDSLIYVLPFVFLFILFF